MPVMSGQVDVEQHEVRQVLSVAEEVSADLVVIGMRRRTPVGKLLMGSVAQRILLGAECAVLAVKPQA
jgi:nucleotide-binding universal stress UspA family protein